MEPSLPRCPDCRGDMMAYPHPGDHALLVWACRACGATFAFDEEYNLRPILLELFYPSCPTCGADMVASVGDTPANGTAIWRCGVCGTTVST